MDGWRWYYKFRLRIRTLFRRSQVERELDEEFRFHLDQRIEQEIARGLPLEEARRVAIRAMEGIEQQKEDCRDMRGLNLIEDVRRDLRYAVRSIRRAPGSAAVAVLSLALAIGVNTAVFSVVNTLILHDLRVARPHELVEIGQVSDSGRGNFSYPVFERIRDENTVLSGVCAVSSGALQATLADAVVQPKGRFVSGAFFEVLGVAAVLGRVLSPDDDRPGGTNGPTVAVIAHGLWQREFGGDPAVIGKTLTIDGIPFTIVGVLPRTFQGLVVGRPDDFFIPLGSEPFLHRNSWLGRPQFGWLSIVGRLKPGISRDTAKADLEVIFARFVEHVVSRSADPGWRRQIRSRRLTVDSARSGLSATRREYSKPVLLLMGAVGLVLLIACANVANLLLARGLARNREVGIRLALGASSGRLVRQLLTEAAVLGLLGGAIGLAFATWAMQAIAAFMGVADPTVSFDIALDSRVLAFTAVICLGSALLAGLVPALRAVRSRVAPGGTGDHCNTLDVSRTATLWTRTLVAGQVALSLLLLTGTSLLIASLWNLRTFDAGFDREHVLLMGLDPAKGGHTGERRLAYYRQVLDHIRSIPGVQGAGLSLITPISGALFDLSFSVEGRPRETHEMVYVNDVSDGYFTAMGTRILLGREFTPQDGPNSVPVAVINEALWRRYFPAENPIGQRIRLGRRDVLEIVGVVGNAKYVSLREEDHPTVYVHALQGARDVGGLTLAVRTYGDPAAFLSTVRRELQSIAAAVPITRVATLAEQIDRSLAMERLMTRLLGAFAFLALLLAMVGLYGVLAYAVTRRTGEIGIRLALGATRGDVLWSVLRESWMLVAIGVAIGVPASLAATRFLSSWLYGVTPTDPWTLAGVVVCLFIVALAAASQPARRAMRVDPLVALRYE